MFQTTHSGTVSGKECIQWNEEKDPDTWNDNYICASKGEGQTIEAG